MNIADVIINLIIWLYQHTVLAVLHTDLGGLSIEDFKTALSGLKDFIITPVYVINKIVALDWLFILLSILLVVELALLGVRIGVFGYNLVRGAGAKV